MPMVGKLRCWGLNTSGQLGDSTTTQKLTPVESLGATGSTWVSAGGTHTCASVDSLKHLKCWGLNGNGQLGDGTTAQKLTPVSVTE